MFSRYFLGLVKRSGENVQLQPPRGFYSLLRVTVRIQNSHPLSGRLPTLPTLSSCFYRGITEKSSYRQSVLVKHHRLKVLAAARLAAGCWLQSPELSSVAPPAASSQPKYGQWMWIMNNMFVTLPSGCSPGLGEYPHTINTCKLHSFSFPKIYTVHIKSRHLTIAEYKADAACTLYYRIYI